MAIALKLIEDKSELEHFRVAILGEDHKTIKGFIENQVNQRKHRRT